MITIFSSRDHNLLAQKPQLSRKKLCHLFSLSFSPSGFFLTFGLSAQIAFEIPV
jgi:hypothetical protein